MDKDLIKNEIQEGLLQVDSSFSLTYFDLQIDSLTRKAEVVFTAQTASGEEVSSTTTYE